MLNCFMLPDRKRIDPPLLHMSLSFCMWIVGASIVAEIAGVTSAEARILAIKV